MKRLRALLLALCAFLLVGSVMAAECTTGQQPWSGGGYSGSTAPGTCSAWINAIGWSDAEGYYAIDNERYVCAGIEPGEGLMDVGFINRACEPAAEPPPTTEPTNSMTTVCNSACTITHVMTVDVPVLNLDTADGALIAGAILAVWALGFAFRAIKQTMDIDGKTSSSTSESDT